MSETLDSVVNSSGGGDFITRFMGQGVKASGFSSGAPFLTLTPPTGQRVRLTHLSTPTGTSQTGLEVSFGSAVIINGQAVFGSSPHGGASSVGRYMPYADNTPPYGNYAYWTGKADEALTVEYVGVGTTSEQIYYGYEYGE